MKNELTQDIIDEVLINNPTKAFKDIHKVVYICKARLERRTYKDIGKELNISPSRVRDYVVRTAAIYRQRKRKEQLREKAHHKMTNWEKIKKMKTDEIAKVLAEECKFCPDGGCILDLEIITTADCRKCIANWLESEVKE